VFNKPTRPAILSLHYLLPSIAAAALVSVTCVPSTAQGTAPTLLLSSAHSLDAAHNSVVFPLHRGTSRGKTVWYILTDTSDAGQAKQRGLIFAPVLAGVGATQGVAVKNGVWSFAAAPDFSKGRVFRPGATGFPPETAQPGATASVEYSPFVRIGTSPTVYNAPIVATGDEPFDVVTHANTADRVLAVNAQKSAVTLLLANGYADGKRVLYISTEASDPGVATIERATYAPGLKKAPQSAQLKILVMVNGRSQGLAYAALHGNLDRDATFANSDTLKTPQNVLGGLPAVLPGSGSSYDPLWSVYVGAWAPGAVSAGKNTIMTSAQAVQRAVDAKLLTGPGGKTFGPVGFAVNCPVIAVYQ